MAIAKNPHSNTNPIAERKAAAFISRAGQMAEEEAPEHVNKKPTMIRIPPDLLMRIDQGAKRLGISRSAFIVSSAAEKLERME
jgi:Ribbon-helix-helix protein, copG family